MLNLSKHREGFFSSLLAFKISTDQAPYNMTRLVGYDLATGQDRVNRS
jgi:hypothetical protein